VQDFTAADIFTSQLVLTTGRSATPTWALIFTARVRVAQRVLGRPVTR